ncbi:ubiquilin-1-like [Gadus chalcogrammus]|uniref:ubiquilin-1-like n=1 Tax=Gadus chalcogrammus TaxID=1042646 RepID=UPI0024C24300|nr:ubiquilin-1-like [Gadus chalcogrammus]
MAGKVKDAEGPAGLFSDSFRVTLKTTIAINDFAVGVNCTVSQLKRCVAKRLGTTEEQLVLIHSGNILRGSDLITEHKGNDGTVNLNMFISPELVSTPASWSVASRTDHELEIDHLTLDNLTPSPTSPLCLVEELGSLGPFVSAPGFFQPLQSQMERQLLSDPVLMSSLLGSPLVQSALSSPQLTKQLLLSNPLILQLLQTSPEVADMMDDPDVIAQMMELTHNPNIIQEVMRNMNCGLTNREPAPADSLQRTKMNSQERSLSPLRVKTRGDPLVTSSSGESQPIRDEELPLPLYRHSTEPLTNMADTPTVNPASKDPFSGGMQSLLEHICACPGLMESLLSGPHVNSILDTLSQNQDLAAQMLLSHPLFSGNPQLQQQIREQLPMFLQQMQSPELLAAMLNPRAMEALLQIQHGLQTLVSEAPALVPSADLESIGVNPADSYIDSPPANAPQGAMVTEQQQMQFVQQMLQMLANTSQQSPE